MLNTPSFIPVVKKRTLLVGLHSPLNKTTHIDSYYAEFLKLARTNDIEPIAFITIKLRSIDSAYFITKGKLEDLKAVCEKEQIEEVIFSDPLSPQQERNLTDYLDCKVIDRTRLILDIFEKSAHSAEGKAQVAIALFQHKKTRLAGKGLFLEQQVGVRGTRGGPGETAKEKEKRIIDDHVAKLKAQLRQLEKTRETQRKQRVNAQIPLVCLVGYTNAGKSTLLNQLTQSSVLAEDKLFATLDTTVRELVVDGKKQALVADTVGFIQQLPPHLIAAFKSTLAELKYAQLLLHVVDCSDKNWQDHIKIVRSILTDLQVVAPVLYVFNKIDLVENKQEIEHSMMSYQPYVVIHANTKHGVKTLVDALREWLQAHKKDY